MDLAVDLIHATVQLEQPNPDGTRTVGTGFLINAPAPDGKPRTVLVTAGHVLNRMVGAEMQIGYRVQNPEGAWSYRPQKITIRDGAIQRWTSNGQRDVAAMVIEAPEAFARAAIPLSWLADGDAFAKRGLGPGDEMMALGFPKGLAANGAGFPILRSGKVASYPLGPSKEFPTFLLDFSVFPGNSGGPIFVPAVRGQADSAPLITGMLTQQVELNSERLEIGIVTQASYIRDTVAMLDAPGAPVRTATAAGDTTGGSVIQAFSASMPAVQVSR